MRVDFPYPGYEGIAPVEIPDANLLAVAGPRAVAADGEAEERLIAGALAGPVGAPRLRQAVRPTDRVLILFDDATRTTPVSKILPAVLEELHAAGVADERIALQQAPGTHRPMTDAELRAKLGTFHGRYPAYEHHYLDRSALHDFGRTRDGTPVTANRRLAEADFVLGIGSIVPHRVKGLSGGAKIAFPGVSGPEMMARNQWEASMHMAETVMGVPENPMRLRMEEAARLAGLRYVVNVIADAEGRIAGCYAGDPVAAHRAAAPRVRRLFAAPLPHRADVVIVDSYPADRDFWQSAKGPYAATMAVRDGGSLILVAPNPEGVARNHENLLEIGFRPHAEIVAMVQRGEVRDLVGAAILADVAQIVERTDCIMVSPGVSPRDAERLGFRWAAAVQEALDLALARQGPRASVAVLRHGGHVLPVVEAEREALWRA